MPPVTDFRQRMETVYKRCNLPEPDMVSSRFLKKIQKSSKTVPCAVLIMQSVGTDWSRLSRLLR